MKKSLFLLIGLLLLSLGALTSCDETKETDPYDDWKVRNEHFLDSIADVAHAHEASGEWKVFRSYLQDYTSGTGSTGVNVPVAEGEVDDYIYVKVLQDARKLADAALGVSDCRSVLYTDSVYVHYKGTLINGERFDGTFTSDLDYEITTPSTFAVSGLVTGFTTALQEMYEGDRRLPDWQYKGDRWLVYIPAALGYGTTDRDNIPAHSVLVFDIALCGIWSAGEEKPVWMN